MNCEYVRRVYDVPAEIGRHVRVYGEPGIIAEDRGHYIGVNFDKDKPGQIHNCHPTDKVVYLEMGVIRSMTKSQARYRRYLEILDLFDSFREFLKWDALPESEKYPTPQPPDGRGREE